MYFQKTWGVHVFIFFGIIKEVLNSAGDRSQNFQLCVYKCFQNQCQGVTLQEFLTEQPISNWLLRWRCDDECQYNCMWTTTRLYMQNGHPVPQFNGKWPFIRFLGIQEPASCLFSIMNLCTHIVCLRWFRARVSSNSPLFGTAHVFALVCVNAWIWSTVFHARDLPLTEHMDYYCAFSLVLCSFYILAIRVLGCPTGWKLYTCVCLILAIFAQHVFYLGWIRFDYGYNLRVNITVGILNGIGWVIWWVLRRNSLEYAWKSALFVCLVAVTSFLEVADFPPILWVFDAHALWHLSTVPIPLLFYSFLIDDSHYLEKENISLEDKIV